jgi:YihY family inner membrane protein
MPSEIEVEKTGSWRWQGHRARQVLRESAVNFLTKDSLTISASIAYHALLAVFPLMLLLLGLSGVLIRHFEFGPRLAVVLERYLPMKPDFILRNLVGISKAYGRVGFISFLLLLWSSSGVFPPLEKALNNAWDVEKRRTWLNSRLLALEMALILGFVILVSSVFVGANVYIHKWVLRREFHHATGILDLAYHFLIFASTFGMTLAMFLVLFERLPNRRIRIRQVFPGALLTAVLWEGTRSLFALLLPVFHYRDVYGSMGALIALMSWTYLSSAVMLFGAQMSQALYRTLEATAPMETAPATSPVHSVGEAR